MLGRFLIMLLGSKDFMIGCADALIEGSSQETVEYQV